MLGWMLDMLLKRAQKLSTRHQELGAQEPLSAGIDALVREGYGLHTAGDFDGAEAVYRKILYRNPVHADTLYLLGEIYQAREDYDQAIALIGKAIASDPSIAAFHASLASLYKRTGNLPAADTSFREAARLDETDFEYFNDWGTVLQELGRHDEALQCYERALALKPDLLQALYNQGVTYRAQGKKERALECYRRAFAGNVLSELPNKMAAGGLFDFANLLQEMQLPQEAIVQYRRALDLDPDAFGTWVNMGNSYKDLKQFDQAQECELEAIRLNPRCAQAFGNLSVFVKEMGDCGSAKTVYKDVAKLVPDVKWPKIDSPHAFCEIDVAQVLIEHALSIDPKAVDCYLNEGVIRESKGDFAGGLACYDKAIELNPESPDAQLYRGMSLLRLGKLGEGWRGYEGRLKVVGKDVNRAHLQAAPLWQGETLSDQVLLVHAEQGLGDTIQFIRYYKEVASRCKKVVLECQEPVRSLIQGMEGISNVYSAGTPLPRFDYQVPLLSLPGIFGTRLDSIPADIPYIQADPSKAEYWRQEVSHHPGLKVGLVWAGGAVFSGNRFRSCSLSVFAPLAGLEGFNFFSLQKGAPEKEAENPPAGMRLLNFSDQLHDFRDTAALIANLDLVIAVDTAVAHLAGAMGKPVWVLIPLCPDWRWLLEREDSPWYPTMRLFRQTRIGDWTPCIDRIKDDLLQLHKTREI